MEKGGLESIRSEEVTPKSQVKELERRVRELEKIIGRKTLENEILREAVKISRGKNSSRGSPCPGWKVWTQSDSGSFTRV